MERSEYERLAAAEERMWWFRGLHDNLAAALAGAAAAPVRTVLDAGCGTGGLLLRLARARPDATLIGIDIDLGAVAAARGKSGCAVCVGSVAALPFIDRSFDAILSADVLCHRGVDERAALAGFRRCLKPGGALVLNLPAYRWLYSAHDAAVDNVRRYGRVELHDMLAAAGFAGIRSFYWNSFLFPLMVLRRKLWRRGGADPRSDVALLPAAVERVFAAIMALEHRLLRAGAALPFGGSILAIAVRP
ncbi:MAG TPA: class I SAM-dependent methyltransferase [Stellaceae bacterium]|nr:class I SAM-dependent methyltransferase [Stellaceae bacterium]